MPEEEKVLDPSCYGESDYEDYPNHNRCNWGGPFRFIHEDPPHWWMPRHVYKTWLKFIIPYYYDWKTINNIRLRLVDVETWDCSQDWLRIRVHSIYPSDFECCTITQAKEGSIESQGVTERKINCQKYTWAGGNIEIELPKDKILKENQNFALKVWNPYKWYGNLRAQWVDLVIGGEKGEEKIGFCGRDVERNLAR